MITHTTPIIALLPSGMEWLWVLLIVVLLFGGAKLPALAKGLGQSIKEFKKAQKDDESEKPAETKSTASASSPKADGKN